MIPYIVPSILGATEHDVAKRLSEIKPYFLRAHLDVLNDTLVSGKSFADPEYFASKGMPLKFEIHLMVTLSQYNLEQWNRDYVDKIIVHIEADEGLPEAIAAVRSWNKKIFLALNPYTELQVLGPYFASVDGIMCMTVNPGHMGNDFQYSVLSKIEELHAMRPDIQLEADGGVTSSTLPLLLEAGVNGAVVGSFFTQDTVEERSLELLGIIEKFSSKT